MNELINEANKKGYVVKTNHFIEEFVALARIQFWLLEEHNICIAALPFFGKYSYMIGTPAATQGKLSKGSGTFGSHDSWMGAFKAGIQEALNSLPDADKDKATTGN